MSKPTVSQPAATLLTIPPAHRQFIVDPLIPVREIMLIAGGSGSGKSTLASQIMVDLQNGLPFFGRKITKRPTVGYLAFDRSEHGMRRTFERSIGYEIPFPFYSAVTSKEFKGANCKSPLGAISHFRTLHPDVDYLTIDGIGMAFKGDSASLAGVSSFIHEIIADMHSSPKPFTIMALQYMPKTKKDAGYMKPREKLHGSVGWAATCETCIIIDSKEDGQSDPGRTITLCPRQGAEVDYPYTFDEDGRLVPYDPDPSEAKMSPKQRDLYSMIGDMPLGIFPMKDLTDAALTIGIASSTARVWIEKLFESQTVIRKAGWGKYERTNDL